MRGLMRPKKGNSMRTNVTYAGYRAEDVIAINDRNGQAIIKASNGFIRYERRPELKPYGFVSWPHRKLGAAMKAARFTAEEIKKVEAFEWLKTNGHDTLLVPR
jgi:hypothetical protein